ncbi:MAG: peptide ABC transporter substrate-binding protein [Dehalococcoidia bacterium]
MWNKRFLVVLVPIAVLIAAACGGDGAPSPTVQPTATPGFQPIATPTPIASPISTPTIQASPQAAIKDPLRGGEFTQLWSDPPTLDPALAGDTTSSGLIVEMFNGLVTIDTDLNIVPDIAERYEITGGDLIYTFHLRRDVRFHDGKPVTAQDFKYSLERALDPATGPIEAGAYLDDIVGAQAKLDGLTDDVVGIEVLGDYVLRITIDEPKPYFLAKLTHPAAFVVDRENVESGPDWTSHPNGTGAFKLAKWEEGEIIRLERNDLFYNGPPHLDAVNFILSGGVGMIMYENGEIDLTGVGLADIERVLDPTGPLNRESHISPPDFSVSYIGLNTKVPPFDDVNVRQALNYAIDKELIAQELLSNLVMPAYGILPPGFPGYNQELEGLRFDLEKAMRLIAESSYGQGDPEITMLLMQADQEADEELRLQLLNQAALRAAANLPPIVLSVAGTGGGLGLDMEVIREMWRRTLGVEFDVQQSRFETYLKDLDERKFQMFMLGWVADYPDPHSFLDILFYSGSLNNSTNYRNMEVDRLLEQARTERDVASRMSYYQQAEQIIVNEAPWIPTWFSGEAYVLIKPRVKGYVLTPLVIPILKDVYIQEP